MRILLDIEIAGSPDQATELYDQLVASIADAVCEPLGENAAKVKVTMNTAIVPIQVHIYDEDDGSWTWEGRDLDLLPEGEKA